MRRHEMTIRTGLVLFVLGVGTALLWPEASPGRLLADSDLATVRGLDPATRGDSIYPVGCEAFQIPNGEATPSGCAFAGGGGGLECEVCSDKIATYWSVGQDDSGPNEVLDGLYQCSGQRSTAPCTGPPGSGQCGAYAPDPGDFCDALIPDYDPE